MRTSVQRLAILGLLAAMMATASGCGIELVYDRTPTYRVVGWKMQVDVIPAEARGTREADRQVGALSVHHDLEVVDGTAMLEVDFGSNGYEPVPIDSNVPQSWKNQIEAKMIAEGHYFPELYHLEFYQTIDLLDLDGAVGIRVSADVEDISTNAHGIDPGDFMVFAGTNQTDLEDGTGDLEDFVVESHPIVPIRGAIFDADEDADIDLYDYAVFQETRGRKEFMEVFTGPKPRRW